MSQPSDVFTQAEVIAISYATFQAGARQPKGSPWPVEKAAQVLAMEAMLPSAIAAVFVEAAISKALAARANESTAATPAEAAPESASQEVPL